METRFMDLDFLVSVVVLVFLFVAGLMFVHSLTRRRGLHDAFNSEDESKVNITGSKIFSPDGITRVFNTKGKSEQNIQQTTVDPNRHSSGNSSKSGGSSSKSDVKLSKDKGKSSKGKGKSSENNDNSSEGSGNSSKSNDNSKKNDGNSSEGNGNSSESGDYTNKGGDNSSEGRDNLHEGGSNSNEGNGNSNEDGGNSNEGDDNSRGKFTINLFTNKKKCYVSNVEKEKKP